MRKKRTKGRVYFTQDTENAIILYNNSKDQDERNQIYREHIEYPLDKMAENIINRFKFPYMNLSFDDVKKQVVSFLVMNLDKYTQNKGKAFSYFSVIAKNYLIHHNTLGYKQYKRMVHYNGQSQDGDFPDFYADEIIQLEAPTTHDRDNAKEFIVLFVEYWDVNLHRIFKKRRDLDIANAVLELFRRVENIENFNKKALYLNIREMTDCQTGYITKVINKMKTYVIEQQKEFESQGTVHHRINTKYF